MSLIEQQTPEEHDEFEEYFGREDDKSEEEIMQELQDRLDMFGQGLEAEALKQEADRMPIEKRWIEDMRQYRGLTREGKEIAKGRYVNITRRKTITGISKFGDMILPNDDRNWSISHTPVAECDDTTLAEKIAELTARLQEAAQQAQAQGGEVQMPGPEEIEEKAILDIDDAAREKCEAMQDEIEDQLAECQYEAACRDAIKYGFVLGTGILKGPALHTVSKRKWVEKKDEQGNVAFVVEYSDETKPIVESVEPWDFFPDMSATCLEDCEFVFQRHWRTRQDIIRLAKNPTFITEQIVKLLKTSVPDKVRSDHVNQLRSMAGISNDSNEKRFIIWEYHGPVKKEDLMLCGCEDIAADDDDPLEEYEGIIFVCNGIVVKAVVNPIDTMDRPYSVFAPEKDDATCFGYGIPYLMRNPQEITNTAWQMILDNAGLSVGGQVIVNDSIIEPVAVNGNATWEIKALKMWRLKDPRHKAQDAFHIFEFPNHQNELSAIFQTARQLADEESGIPLVAEGESGKYQTTTSSGMEMLLNSHAIIMRSACKSWDDDVTVPLITRFYDYNMQFNPKNEIKGDYAVDARGSSALLVKETQARNILNLINFAQSPALAGWFKFGPLAEKLATSMQLSAEEYVKTVDEYAADQEAQQQAMAQQQQDAAAQQGQQGGGKSELDQARIAVEQQKLEFGYKEHQEILADKQQERQVKMQLAETSRQTEIIKLAQQEKIEVSKIEAMLRNTEMKGVIDRSKIADEAKIKLRTGSGI